MLISEHASFLGLHTAQLLITLKLLYNMKDGVELLRTFNVRSVPCVFHIFCTSSCVHCHFYLALLITVYSVLILTHFKFCVSLIGDLHAATFIINVICSPFMQQQVACTKMTTCYIRTTNN